LSTLHEGFSTAGDLHPSNSQNRRHRLLGLQQYNQAVRRTHQLLETKTPRAVDVVLVSCILFICHELIQYNHHMALQHLENGLRVLVAAPVTSINQPVAQLFSRIVIQSMFLGDAHVKPHKFRKPQSYVEQAFTSTLDARDGLEEQFLLAYPLVFAAPYKVISSDQIANQYQIASCSLARWEEPFRTFLSQYHISFTAKDASAIELLQIHCQSLSIMVQLAAGYQRASATSAFLNLINLVNVS
jgi:hypothetical protein